MCLDNQELLACFATGLSFIKLDFCCLFDSDILFGFILASPLNSFRCLSGFWLLLAHFWFPVRSILVHVGPFGFILNPRTVLRPNSPPKENLLLDLERLRFKLVMLTSRGPLGQQHLRWLACFGQPARRQDVADTIGPPRCLFR